MRMRKKPNLRVSIPSYPDDYVEMPPEVRRLTASTASPRTEQRKTDFPNEPTKSDDSSTKADANDNSKPSNSDDGSTKVDENDYYKAKQGNSSNVNVQNEVPIGRSLPNYEDKPDLSILDGLPVNKFHIDHINDIEAVSQEDTAKSNVQIGKPLPNYEDTPCSKPDSTEYKSEDSPQKVNVQVGMPLPNYEDLSHPSRDDSHEISNNDDRQDDSTKANIQVGRSIPSYEDITSSNDITNSTKNNSEGNPHKGNIVIGRHLPNYEDPPQSSRDDSLEIVNNFQDDSTKANVHIGRSLPNYEDITSSSDIPDSMKNNSESNPYKGNILIGRPLPNYEDLPHPSRGDSLDISNNFQDGSTKANVQIGRSLPNYEDITSFKSKPHNTENNSESNPHKENSLIGRPYYEDLLYPTIDDSLKISNNSQVDSAKANIQIGRSLPNYEDIPSSKKHSTDSHQDYYPKTNYQDDPNKANFHIGIPVPNYSYEDRPYTPEIKITESSEDLKNSDKKDNHHVNFGEVIYRKISRSSMSVPYGLQYGKGLMKKDHLNIPEHHQSSGSGFSDGDHDEHNEILSDDDRAKVPLRSPRRKSAAPRRLRSEFSMDDDYSPSNSVTSVNSLASLLKEKLQSIPQKIRKKPTDYKLRAFVGLMFLAVVFFVGFAYVLYHQQALTKAYFESVQFNEPKRLVRIFGKDSVEILRASLGIGLGKVKAFPCLPEHRHKDGSECLEWLHNLRFYLKMIPHDPGLDNTTCYSVHWKALRSDVYPNDCFDWGETKVHWYGGGQSLNLTWPLDTGSIDYTPFITGDMQKSQFGNVLTRYFINSKGAAIIIDEETPLQVSVNKGGKQICLRAQYDEFAYANQLTEFPEMKYNICTSTDMRSLHSSIHSHRRAPLWDGLKPADIQTLDSLISEPVWQIAPRFKHELQAETISKYTEDVINLGFLKQGHVLINEHWQNEIGDLSVDTSRFEILNDTVDKLHRRGFKVAFTIQPFISTESKNFAECVQKRLLISERNSDRRIPALTRFKSLASAGVLDITNNRSIPWILEKLQAVIDQYHIDSFYFDLGTAYNIPHYYRCEKFLINPDQYKTHFTKTFEKTLNIIGVSSAVTLPRPPIFVSLPPFESSWEALRSVIPTMLTYGVNGFPFIMPGAVGGDIYWPGSEQFLPSSRGPIESVNATHENGIALPERELYIRWLQMATFLPVMKFTHLPSKYNDERVLEMAKNLTLLRQKQVAPLLLKYKREALEEGLPLIRPLWLVAGGDAALLVRDEFAIGDEIVVAPVLEQGQTTREVYLPAGLWQDGIDGSLRKGNRWMHDYKVPLHRVAYFIRKPDDMRFR